MMPMANNDQAGRLMRPKKSPLEDGIVADLRRKIVAGILKPGTRLPTYVQLAKERKCAVDTVQRAMSRLIRDGFLVPRGGLGTFVMENPSHLHRYGVVFSVDPTDPRVWDRIKFQPFLYREVVAMRGARERDIVPYLKVNGTPDSEDYQRLLDDIRNERLAGVVFDAPTHLAKPHMSALLDTPGMPFVTIGEDTLHANLSTVYLDRFKFVERALDYLLTRKRRRVALLAGSTSYYHDPLFGWFEHGVARRRMTTRPYWIQNMFPGVSMWASNSTHLLMKATDIPNALIITDDTLVEHATTGLVDADVRIPQELEVVAHCNFPAITPSMVPAKRLGFDVRQVLNTCLDVIDRRRRHEDVPLITKINPLFDDEVKKRPPNSEDGNDE